MTTKKRIILVLLSVVLLSLGWLGASGISLLVALVPLLILSEHYSASTKDFWRMAAWGALTFILWHAATVWWVWIATPIGPIAAGAFGTFWNLVALMTYHYVSKRAPRALAYTLLVALWLTTESLYNSAEVLTFPWLLLGHGFSNDIWAVQWYEYTGIFGGSLWVLATNLSIFEILRTRSKTARVRAALVALLPMLLSIALYFGYTPSERHAMLAVVQPNVACYDEDRARQTTSNTIDDVRALTEEVTEDASFVILPESALSYVEGFGTIDERYLEFYADVFADMQSENMRRAKLITGASTVRFYGSTPATDTARKHPNGTFYDLYNSALLIDSLGAVDDVYHKGKLVIGVEAVPFRELFSLFEVDLGGVSGQLGWGRDYTLFENEGVKIGPSICYEGIYGEYFAGFARHGAELMALISNDGWWGDTPGHRRLFDFARLRAIETRRAIARSANTGISGFISPRGETLGERLEWDERGVLNSELELRDELTIYTRYGDWIARIATYVSILGLMYYVAYRVRRRNHLVD
ncbi:MAG: apolipoprotein N-acyltransferase [Alistipes sp.]|nr:apolipoprotein N-acyltransferase [Alistipes sp.]